MAAAARTVDWVTAVATALAAVGTLAAVLGALFGPDIRTRRRRPVIGLEPEVITFEIGPDGAGEPQILVSNAPGRDVAQVEIRLSVGEDEPDEWGGPGGGPLIVNAMPLNWDSALLG